MATITLYGSNATSADLPSASQMASASGGSEVPTYTSPITVATNQFLEFPSRVTGGTSYNSLPAPSGKGWVYKPGAGTFALGNWTSAATFDSAYATFTYADIRLYKYSSGTYTAIGTIQYNVNLTPKTTYTHTVSMPAVTFLATDLLYIDAFWDDSTGAGDGQQLYISNSGTAGVVNDLQITTSNFTASGSVTNTWTANDDPLTPSDSISETLAQSTTDSVSAPTDTFSFATVGVTPRYLTRLKVGTTSYQFDVFQNDTESAVGPSVTFTCTPGTFYWTRLRVQGNTLYGKVWADGSGEPAWAIITKLDVQVTTGSVGVMLSSTSASLPVKIDNFSITNLGGPVDASVMALAAPLLMAGTDALTVTESASEVLAQSATDSLTSLETNVETKVQLASDSLANVETASEVLAQTITDSLTSAETVLEVLAQASLDSLTSLETNVETKVQLATDSLTSVETSSEILTASFTDSVAISENATFVALALIDQTAITESWRGVLATTQVDGALSIAETNATVLALAASELLTQTEIDATTLALVSSDALSISDSFISSASTNILLPDVALAPTESVFTALTQQGSDLATVSDAPTLTLALAATETVVASDSFSSILSTIVALPDVALASSEALTLGLTQTVSDILTQNDVSRETLAVVFVEGATQPLESVLVAGAFAASELLVESETSSATLNMATADSSSVAEAISLTGQKGSSDVLAVVEVALEGLAASTIESVTLSEASSSTTVWVSIDSMVAADSTSSFNAYVYLESVAVTETPALTLLVNDVTTDTLSENFSYSSITGPSLMTGLDQNTVSDAVAPTMLAFITDFAGVSLEQDALVTQMLVTDALVESESMVVIATPSFNFVDSVTETETLLSTTARTFTEGVTLFEFDALAVAFHPTDALTPVETLTSFALSTMSSVDALSSTDSAQSTSIWQPIDATPVGEGLAALPFAFASHFSESVISADSVQGAVNAPLTDVPLTLTDKAGATFTLSFADSLITADVSRETLTVLVADTPPPMLETIVPLSYSNLLLDTLVPSDSMYALVTAPLGPDALYPVETIVYVTTFYMVAQQRVRSGKVTMMVRSGTQHVQVRSGKVTMTTHTGTVTQKVRSGLLTEHVP